jgi:hypothetical protein
MNAASSDCVASCRLIGRQHQNGHPWPDFGESGAIVPDGRTASVRVACAIFPFADITPAIHGLTLEKAV